MYAKLNATEPGLAEALVTHTAQRMHAVLDSGPGEPQPFAGLRLKVVDGNYLAGTDRRLAVLRGHGAAADAGRGWRNPHRHERAGVARGGDDRRGVPVAD